MYHEKDFTVSSTALFKYITKEKKDVTAIYVYAILSGLVQLSIPLGIQAIVSFVMGATMVTSLYLLIAFVVLGTFLAGFFRIKVMQIIEKIQQKIFVEYSIAFAKKIPKINLSATKKYFLPELVNRFFDTQNLQKGISKILLDIPTALIQISFGILLLSFYHPWFLVFGALVVIIVIFIFRFTMNSGIRSSLEESDKKYEVASWLEDVASAIKTFKINSNADMHLTGTDERVVEYLENRTEHFKVLEFQYKAIIGFKVIITLVMLGIGTYLLVNQKLNIGAFIATEIVVLTIMNAVESLIKSLESYYDVIAALVKLNKVTDLSEETTGDIVLEQVQEGLAVSLQDVNFAFNDQKPILKNISFEVKPNTINVISGSLGAGKTTLLNVMAGFFEATSGVIMYDKIPFKNLNKMAIRDKIGLYTHDMVIIKGTLLENILLGRNDISTEEIMELCDQIGLGTFSSQFSNGFDTELSETDTEVSYSGKKKITLLRALLGKNRLIMLEDPLYGMDDEFKRKMLAYLMKIKNNSTIIIISRSRELLEIADRKFQLNDGTITIDLS
ncbi:peptidase domain-containing ABC transporter [Pedobacter sandarakinus]|uniref:peptidase domain-containing ABC transporter n=1 Tax=Pedobacter sandarakinus TaxID=353156 RepID=UPI002245729D|nr:ABC transporter ATP-binding protein [Pedobacter sandarakinus]MCX2574183.1 ABC transporter ATP-binding protein [Pedobacter sandarakinus]